MIRAMPFLDKGKKSLDTVLPVVFIIEKELISHLSLKTCFSGFRECKMLQTLMEEKRSIKWKAS